MGACGFGGIVVDGADRIYVSDPLNSRIARVDDLQGRGWSAFGSAGSGKNEFNNEGELGIAL
jgi:hypothetical protein